MKKLFFALFLLMAIAGSAVAQSNTVTVREVDGFPSVPNVRNIIVSNGSLTVSGRDAYISTGGGGGGTGDVVGPGSATDNAVVRFNTTTGKLVQNSLVIIGDTGNVTGIVNLDFSGILTGGSGPTTITDSVGKILSAALNTVQPAQGGTGITSLGTGVAAALGVNVGSAGAFITFNGAGGTPLSITLTNGTGLPLTTGVAGDLPFSSFVQASSAGFVGATGAGDYSHRTPTQVTAALDAFTGDSGSGGTKGLVPAPASGDAAANKYLKADGTWATVSGGSGITVGTTTVTSGTATRLFYETAGNVVGQVSGFTSDGTNVTAGSGNLRATSPRITTGINDANGNVMLAFSPAGSATEYITIANNTATNAVSLTASSPTVAASAQAGTPLNLTASPAIAGNVNVGAAAGGSVTITAGAAARLTSGNANGGNINLVTGAGIGTGTAGQVLIPAGVVAAPSIGFTGATTTGIYSASGLPSIAVGGVQVVRFHTASGGGIDVFGDGTTVPRIRFGTGIDVTIRRGGAAATVGFGDTDAASPVAQTMLVQSVVAGTTNTAGVDWTLKASAGTGTGAGGGIIFSTAPAGTTGTSQNSFSEAFRINNYGGIRPKSVTFASLPGSPTNADQIYCSDCQQTSAFVDSTCTSGGSGAMAFRVNGAWKCFN